MAWRCIIKDWKRGTYEVPSINNDAGDLSISHEALQHILQGVSLRSVRKRKRYQQTAQSCG